MIELAKNYAQSFIFIESGKKTELTYALLFDFVEACKFVQMGLNRMLDETMSTIKAQHLINLYVSCIAYGFLIVDDD